MNDFLKGGALRPMPNALTTTICRVCRHQMGPGGIPFLTRRYLPSRSRGDVSSFVMLRYDVCLRCRLLYGEVIEYREGFSFLSRDGTRTLYTVVLAGKWIVRTVDRDTLEQRVEPIR
jgi:hypothetical protein